VRQQRALQFDLFQDSDPPQALPATIEEEVLGLLVQMLQAIIPGVAAEAADDQDHG
jgi:hypothetical protein